MPRTPARGDSSCPAGVGVGLTKPAIHQRPNMPTNHTPARRDSAVSGSIHLTILPLWSRPVLRVEPGFGAMVTIVKSPKSRRVYTGVRSEIETRFANRKGGSLCGGMLKPSAVKPFRVPAAVAPTTADDAAIEDAGNETAPSVFIASLAARILDQ